MGKDGRKLRGRTTGSPNPATTSTAAIRCDGALAVLKLWNHPSWLEHTTTSKPLSLDEIHLDGAVRRGWVVTTFNRCRSAVPPAGVETIHGDRERPADLARLAAAGPWDVVVDVTGSVPTVVRDAARALATVSGRYVFVSTISAYRDWPHAPVDEESPLWDGDPDYDPGTRAWDPDAYGPLKVGGEIAARQAFGADRLLILRPHVVLVPYEYVGRLPWWLSRMHTWAWMCDGGRPVTHERFVEHGIDAEREARLLAAWERRAGS